jgi:hypothetical protein
MPVHMPSTLNTRRGLMPHINEACRVHTHDVVQHTPATQRGRRFLPASRKLTDTNVFGKNRQFRGWALKPLAPLIGLTQCLFSGT